MQTPARDDFSDTVSAQDPTSNFQVPVGNNDSTMEVPGSEHSGLLTNTNMVDMRSFPDMPKNPSIHGNFEVLQNMQPVGDPDEMLPPQNIPSSFKNSFSMAASRK